ncbi:MFS transporter [candidate division KSB1 bacterium]|nr:MFS transporter [candidate division KSB1 bacterium]
MNDARGLKTVFRSLNYRNYRLFFSGQSISLIGTWIQRIAMAWLVYRLTDSAFLLGVFGFAGQIPTFLLSPFAGVFTDRVNRYHLLVITQVLAMVQASILAILVFVGTIDVWHILLLSIVLGCINAIDIPVRQSFVVEMIENKNDLGNAIALNSSMVNGARLIGPSIAGVLIASMGEGICFLLNAISYLFVIASLLLMNVKIAKRVNHNPNVMKELKEGFSYTFGFAPIRSIILLLGLISLMGMPYAVLMPIFSKEILQGGSHTFGFLMGASGIGALTGALYLASRKSVLGLERIIPFAAGFFGLGLVIFSLSRLFLLSLILMIFIGLAMMLQMASSNTILQTIVEDDKRGRVMSFYSMAFVGSAPLGSLLAGSLASIWGAPTALMIGGLICISGALVFANKLTALRKLIHPIYVQLGIIPEVATGIQTVSEFSVPPEK